MKEQKMCFEIAGFLYRKNQKKFIALCIRNIFLVHIAPSRFQKSNQEYFLLILHTVPVQRVAVSV